MVQKQENEQPNPIQPEGYSPPCPECRTGVMRMQYLTYFTWLNDELVTVPNFPSWVCDVCGRRDYDARAINWLNTLLSPNTGRRPSSRRRHRPPRMDRPQPQ